MGQGGMQIGQEGYPMVHERCYMGRACGRIPQRGVHGGHRRV